MESNQFAIGDRVSYYVRVVKSDKGRAMLGKHGNVIDFNGKKYLVEFDSDVGGHDGDGMGQDGHCFWIREEFLAPVGVEQEKKEGIMGTLTQLGLIARRTLDKDLRVLVKAGVLNKDLSVRDADSVLSLVVISQKAELAKMIRERMAEDKEDQEDAE